MSQLPESIWEAPQVKVFYTPPELDSYKIINVLEEYGIEISPGIGKLKHSIIRLGTMGTAANTNELEYLDEIVHAKIKALL
mgnify:FL=1